METTLDVRGVTRRYGTREVLKGITFAAQKGEIIALLGRNGTGKSTLMNTITGYLCQSGGDISICGYDVLTQPLEARRRTGYLPEQPPLYPDRTPREYLRFVAEAKRVPASEIRGQIDRVLDITQTAGVADRLIKNLSKGYRQRVGIAQALLGSPRVIILDEPTVGLDPKQIVEIRDLIKELGREHTVILSSHILSEVQAICTTILIISEGRLVACDTAENLEKLFAGSVSVELDVDADEAEAGRIVSSLPAVSKSEISKRPDGGSHLRLEAGSEYSDSVCRELSLAFAGSGHAVLQMTTSKASLEDIFIELTGSEKEADKT